MYELIIGDYILKNGYIKLKDFKDVKSGTILEQVKMQFIIEKDFDFNCFGNKISKCKKKGIFIKRETHKKKEKLEYRVKSYYRLDDLNLFVELEEV